MHDQDRQHRLADALLSGPRGRRLLLEYALASERIEGKDERDDSLSLAVFIASYHLELRRGSTSGVLMGPGAKEIRKTVVTPEETAARLEGVTLAEVTPRSLLLGLVPSVETATYWQEPQGDDVLAATDPMRAGLRRVAEHLAASTHTDWWSTPVEASSQCTVQWDGELRRVPEDPLRVLRKAWAKDADEEKLAARERPTDPTASWSGIWWSTPPRELPSSTRAMFDTSPVGLWLVEDSMGWETAETLRLEVPEGLRVYEIDSAQAWAELCRRFPFEQTAQKRHDWYLTTGRTGKWVVPDWAKVAEHYDAVHLQVAAYLAAAGTAIPVDADTATVIAGWGPDETYWFTPRVNHLGTPTAWILTEDNIDYLWERQPN